MTMKLANVFISAQVATLVKSDPLRKRSPKFDQNKSLFNRQSNRVIRHVLLQQYRSFSVVIFFLSIKSMRLCVSLVYLLFFFGIEATPLNH